MSKSHKSESDSQTNFDEMLFPRPNIGLSFNLPRTHVDFEQESIPSFNNVTPQAVCVEAVKKTLPPLKPTYKQRIKYEVSHYILESIKLICPNQDKLTGTLKKEKNEAEDYIHFYESRVKKPGSARILQGLTLIGLLCRPYPPKNEIRQLYSEADDKDAYADADHQPQRRNLDRAKRILLQMKGENDSNNR